MAAFDEMNGANSGVRPAYGELARWLGRVPPDELDHRRSEAELLRRIGITFAVYGEAEAQERLIPFDQDHAPSLTLPRKRGREPRVARAE